MKTFIAAVLATLAFIVPAHASTLEEITQNTYRLYSNDRKICSIQSVNMGDPLYKVFLTAQHCVDAGGNFSLFLPVYNDKLEIVSKTYRYLNEVYNGNLMGKGEDVATLELRPRNDLPPSTWGSGVDVATEEQINNLKIGDTLTTVGYPSTGWSDDLYISTGAFLGFTESPGGRVPGKWIKTSIPVDGGSSGGGLYLKDGDEYYLVSVTSQKDPGTTAPMSYYTDPEFIRNALDPCNYACPITVEETAKVISDALKGISEILN